MPENAIVVDHRGDLRLKVGQADDTGFDPSQQYAEFVVCSRTLARASPVFDRMLYGAFAEAKHNSNSVVGWIVRLAEEKPAPMEIFLNITHANFAKIPRILSVDNLYELAALTHYYDATTLLAPWLEGWLASTIEMTRDANILMPKMLWISWEFGRKEDFVIAAQRMLMEATLSQSTNPEINTILTPPYVNERINAIRIQTIQGLLDTVGDIVEKLMVVNNGPRWCRHAKQCGHHRCESMALGSMTFCLARAGLWPLPAALDVELSLLDLYRTLTSLIIHDIGETAEKPLVDHRDCNPRSQLMNRVEQVMRHLPSPLSEYHVNHFEKQAEGMQPAGLPR